MKLREVFVLYGKMPINDWCDLGAAVVDQEIARLDLEEAQEQFAAAQAAVELKKLHYGVGK